jgi:hypothetical protein
MTRSRRKHAIVRRGTDDEAVNYPKAARKRDRKALRHKTKSELSKFAHLLDSDSKALQARRSKISFAGEDHEPFALPARAPRKGASCRYCAELHRHRCLNRVALDVPTFDAARAKKVEAQYEKFKSTMNPAFLAQYRRYKYK